MFHTRLLSFETINNFEGMGPPSMIYLLYRSTSLSNSMVVIKLFCELLTLLRLIYIIVEEIYCRYIVVDEKVH